MIGGDTLIVGNGTYANNDSAQDNVISSMPSGSAGAYTTIRTENVHGATIDSSSVTADWSDTGLSIGSLQSYIQIEGFRIKGNPTHSAWSNGPILLDGSYCKLLRIAAFDAPYGDMNMQVFSVKGSYNLIEECWGWGGGRYKFLVYGGNNPGVDGRYNIIRRCVARHDYVTPNLSGSGFPNQEACFTNYDASNTLMQNNICIDSDYISEGQNMYGGFWDENNASTVDKSGKIVGSIVLNLHNASGGIQDRSSGTRVWQDNVIWDSDGGWITSPPYGEHVTPHYTINKLTIGHITKHLYPQYGNGVGAASTTDIDLIMANSLVYDAIDYGLGGYMPNDYIALYGNTANYGPLDVEHTPTGGAHNITNVNPLTNCLKYLPRIESTNCTLYTGGSSGGRIGAEILYKYGTDGTLYGETGYDTLTSEPLWPFPNEDLIKADFASYDGPGPAGARGFAASGLQLNGTDQITLTSYIWEYLGNQMPADLYGGSTSNGSASLTGYGGGGGQGTLTAVGLGLGVASLTGQGGGGSQGVIGALGLSASGIYKYANIVMQ